MHVDAGDRARAAVAPVRRNDEIRLEPASVRENGDGAVAVRIHNPRCRRRRTRSQSGPRRQIQQHADEFVVRHIDAERRQTDLARPQAEFRHRQKLIGVVDHVDRFDGQPRAPDALQRAERIEKPHGGFEQRDGAARQRRRNAAGERRLESPAREGQGRREAGRPGVGDKNVRSGVFVHCVHLIRLLRLL